MYVVFDCIWYICRGVLHTPCMPPPKPHSINNANQCRHIATTAHLGCMKYAPAMAKRLNGYVLYVCKRAGLCGNKKGCTSRKCILCLVYSVFVCVPNASREASAFHATVSFSASQFPGLSRPCRTRKRGCISHRTLCRNSVPPCPVFPPVCPSRWRCCPAKTWSCR